MTVVTINGGKKFISLDAISAAEVIENKVVIRTFDNDFETLEYENAEAAERAMNNLTDVFDTVNL